MACSGIKIVGGRLLARSRCARSDHPQVAGKSRDHNSIKIELAPIASIIGEVRLSNSGWIVVLGFILLGVTGQPTPVFTEPQARPSEPFGQAPPSPSQQPISTPAKQPGAVIEYRNKQYGFCFSLPQGWRGFSIKVDQWKGYSNSSEGDAVTQRGPLISIRHPRWTQANPRQDIPIMVFTLAQWDSLQRDDFHVSAAPIGPSELGQNRKYVFALPPRFDWAYPTGYEEVEQILSTRPLRAGFRTSGRACRQCSQPTSANPTIPQR